MRISSLIMLILLISFLASCAIDDTETYAPVIDASAIEKIPGNGVYRATQTDTLYSIAWRYGLDYRSLATRNHLHSPYAIYSGQVIYLRGMAPRSTQQTVAVKTAAEWGHLERGPQGPVAYWTWPAQGEIVGKFSESNKGINIAGHEGDPIYATAAGKVVYSGNGLRWYGNLIIIKHNSTFLTAYAHNSSVYVKEGEWVKAGQKIAEMGNTGARRVMLHFEIRRDGQSVNPLVYLPKDN